MNSQEFFNGDVASWQIANKYLLESLRTCLSELRAAGHSEDYICGVVQGIKIHIGAMLDTTEGVTILHEASEDAC